MVFEIADWIFDTFYNNLEINDDLIVYLKEIFLLGFPLIFLLLSFERFHQNGQVAFGHCEH